MYMMKHVLVNVQKCAKHRSAAMSLSQKNSSWSGNTVTLKKRFQAQWSVKVMLTIFWDMKGHITTDFLEKGTTINSISYYQLLR